MQNKTSVINAALMRCGAAGVNLAFQDSPAAQAAEAAYQRSLDVCLSLYPWPFAVRLVRLAENAQAPAFGWRHAYALPADCVRVMDVRVHDGAGRVSMGSEVVEVRYELVGRDIHTDAESVALRYVSNDRNLSFPDTFADALTWRLCAEMAPYLEQSGNAQLWMQLFEQSLDRAKVEAEAQQHAARSNWPSRVLAEREVR